MSKTGVPHGSADGYCDLHMVSDTKTPQGVVCVW